MKKRAKISQVLRSLRMSEQAAQSYATQAVANKYFMLTWYTPINSILKKCWANDKWELNLL